MSTNNSGTYEKIVDFLTKNKFGQLLNQLGMHTGCWVMLGADALHLKGVSTSIWNFLTGTLWGMPLVGGITLACDSLIAYKIIKHVVLKHKSMKQEKEKETTK